MKFIVLLFAFLAGVTLLSPVARAQESTGTHSMELQSIHDQLVLKIETLKYAKLKTALALDNETAKQFFEIYKPAEKEIQAIVKERNEEMKKLALLMNGAKTDADVDPVMQKI